MCANNYQGDLQLEMQRFLSFSPPRLLLQGLRAPLLQFQRGVILLTNLKLVDNSENAKRVTRLDQPYCIKLPKNNKVAGFGDIIRIAHRGKTYKALIVSNRKTSKRLPRYDSHNIVLLDEKHEPIGTRVVGPLPSAIRKKEKKFAKVASMASKFI